MAIELSDKKRKLAFSSGSKERPRVIDSGYRLMAFTRFRNFLQKSDVTDNMVSKWVMNYLQ